MVLSDEFPDRKRKREKKKKKSTDFPAVGEAQDGWMDGWMGEVLD